MLGGMAGIFPPVQGEFAASMRRRGGLFPADRMLRRGGRHPRSRLAASPGIFLSAPPAAPPHPASAWPSAGLPWRFRLKRTQSLGLRDIQATILGLPVMQRRFGDAVLAQHRGDLLFRAPRSLHLSVLPWAGPRRCVEEIGRGKSHGVESRHLSTSSRQLKARGRRRPRAPRQSAARAAFKVALGRIAADVLAVSGT